MKETIVAERLGIFSLALIIVYAAGVLTSILPPQLLDPIWQLSSIKIVLDNAPIPLLGLGLLHLAAHLAPHDSRLQHRRDAMARMAIVAALGFLLIIPLQSYSVWKTYTDTKVSVNRQQSNFAGKAESIRQAVDKSTSLEDLQKRLQSLQSPDLRINFNEANLSAIPLPQLKQQILSQLDQAEGRFKRTISDPDQSAVEGVTRASVRTIISAAAFAIAFAAGAQRKNSPVPFLVEVPYLPGRMIGSLLPRRARSGQGSEGAGFLKSASKREEEFFKSLAPPEDEEPPAPWTVSEFAESPAHPKLQQSTGLKAWATLVPIAEKSANRPGAASSWAKIAGAMAKTPPGPQGSGTAGPSGRSGGRAAHPAQSLRTG